MRFAGVGFKLVFTFKENTFFTNTTLTKTYVSLAGGQGTCHLAGEQESTYMEINLTRNQLVGTRSQLEGNFPPVLPQAARNAF